MYWKTLKIATVVALLASPSAFAAIPGAGAPDGGSSAVASTTELHVADNHRDRGHRGNRFHHDRPREFHGRGHHRPREFHRGWHRRDHYRPHRRHHYRWHHGRHFRGRPIRRWFRHWRRYH